MVRNTRIRRERHASGEKDRSQGTVIDLLPTVRLLNQHLTESLCQEVFQTTRLRERERVWSLYALAHFWTHIVLKAPGSLTQALEDALRGQGIEWPSIAGSPQAFFNRSQTLPWTFAAALYERYVTSLTPSAPTTFAREFEDLRKHFTEVWVVDGSRLDAIAHRLKILWDVRSPMLPGCLLAFYDLFRGYPRLLKFDPDAAQAEMNRVREALPQVPQGTLLLGDRLYASVQLFEDLGHRSLWGLFRRSKRLKIQKLQCLKRQRVDGGILEDWLVDVGCGATAPKQRLRYLRLQKGKKVYELLTNVLDRRKLPAKIAMELYSRRWDVERMFFDLKVVLNLHRFYAANPNGVALQVYAATMVYVAMRVAQAQAARKARVQPEEISPAKFFPRVANACATLAGIELGYLLTCLKNPGRRLKPPDATGRPELTTTLGAIRVQPRDGPRRKRRFCNSRRRWKSFAHVSGGQRFLN
jgi:hypothetical protein